MVEDFYRRKVWVGVEEVMIWLVNILILLVRDV